MGSVESNSANAEVSGSWQRWRISRKLLKLGLIFALVLSLIVAGIWYRSLPVEPDQVLRIPVVVDGTTRVIEVEVFEPASNETKRPAIVYLHGVEGALKYRAAHSRSCEWLTEQGYVVFYVHYFDAVQYSDLLLLTPDWNLDTNALDRICRRDAHLWCDAVLQVVQQLGSRADIASDRIAIDGISLGGFIALEVADETHCHGKPIAPCAIIANWCGQFELTECQSGFPPTLHVHGEFDPIVPLADAQASFDEIKSVASESQFVVVKGAEHLARDQLSDEATLAFLAKHLSRQ